MLEESSPRSLLQPREMIALTPEILIASRMMAVSFSGSSTTILPNPIYTGGDPALNQASNPTDGEYDGGSRKKNPQISNMVSVRLSLEIVGHAFVQFRKLR
jgi:hypothetical protein